MSADNNNEPILSDPWWIEFSHNDSQVPHDLTKDVTAQVERLAVNEQNVSVEPKSTCSWSKHERLTGEILNQAAQRASAETYKNVCVYHPTQNHRPSKDAPNIRPDYVIAWSYNGKRQNTAVVDAKDHHGNVPRTEYEKICRDMRETKATRGILVPGENASIGDKLRADIEKDNKVDIVEMKNGRTNVVRDVTQHIGKIIDKDFVPDDKRWETYQPFVTSAENSQERRPNRHGENAAYTCSSTYHRFKHPQKQDGTIDERYEANRDRNKDGGPDMRVAHNKEKQAQEQHLNEDGSKDMRSKEHREELADETGHRLNVDQTRDMRYKENTTDTPANVSSKGNNGQKTENIDMRQKENREDMIDNEGHHLNADGSSDMRCKENQEGIDATSSNKAQLDTNQTVQEKTDVTNTTISTKNDGTADMRYTVSKEAVASGAIEANEQLTEGNGTVSTGDNEGFSGGSTSADIPTKSDGTADMRFSASQDAVASGEISGGDVLSGGHEGSIGGTVESSSGMMDSMGSGGGPSKADGTPDMRFSANQ